MTVKYVTNDARERKALTDACLERGLSYCAISHSLRDAMPETLLPRLGRVVYEVSGDKTKLDDLTISLYHK